MGVCRVVLEGTGDVGVGCSGGIGWIGRLAPIEAHAALELCMDDIYAWVHIYMGNSPYFLNKVLENLSKLSVGQSMLKVDDFQFISL